METRKYLGGGGGGKRGSFSSAGMSAHALAGAMHTADTITNLNTKLTDGSLITTKAAEIVALPPKAVPTVADLLMIEDAADGTKKKQITIGTLPYNINWIDGRIFYAPQATTPGNAGTLCFVGGADMPINSVSSATTDGLNVSLNVAGMGSAFNSCCHFSFPAPVGSTNVRFTMFNKPAGVEAPSKNVRLDFYGRNLPDLGLPTAWSALAMHIISVPATQIWQYTTLIIPLATLGLSNTGINNQVALYRNGTSAEDTSSLNWNLHSVRVSFS
jgi:hypothetical protein